MSPWEIRASAAAEGSKVAPLDLCVPWAQPGPGAQVQRALVPRITPETKSEVTLKVSEQQNAGEVTLAVVHAVSWVVAGITNPGAPW